VATDRPLLLIVDDEPSYTEVLAEACEERGFEVDTANTASAGVQKALQRAPTVILMDVMMPGLTGWEALRQLTTDPRTRTIPVVMMTGRQIDTSDPVGPHTEAAALILKPFQPEALFEVLDRVLGSPSGSAA
jgi:twitching motility two-component system response regulator PilH